MVKPLVLVHKKGDVWEIKNYRGISLLQTAYKILVNIIYNHRLKPIVEKQQRIINVDLEVTDLLHIKGLEYSRKTGNM